MKCSNCGVELADDALFCHECGTKVEVVEVVEESAEKVVEKVAEETHVEEASTETADNKASAEINNKAEVSETQTESKNTESENAETDNKNMDYIFCPECGTKNEKGAMFCASCGKRFGEDVFQAVKEKDDKKAAKKKAKDSADNEKKGGIKKVLPVIIGVAAVAVIACLLYTFVPKLFGGNAKQNYTLHYIKDNHIYSAKGSKYKPKEIANHYFEDESRTSGKTWYMGPQMSSNEKYVVYIKKIGDYNSGDLYFQKNGKPDTEEKLASSVTSFRCIGNDYVVYETDDSRLYYIDYKGNKEKIASDVAIYDISENERYVLIQEWVDSEYKIYLFDFNNVKDGKEKLTSVTRLEMASKNFDNLIYIKDDSLYIMKNFKTEEKLAKKVSRVDPSEKDGKISVYYATINDEEEASMYDFVNDPSAASDSNMELPQIADYQKKKSGSKLFDWDDVETDDQYYKDYEAYQRKVDRDDIREALKEEKIDVITYNIYYYTPNSKEPVKLCESRMFKDAGDYFSYFAHDLIMVVSLNDNAENMFDMDEISNYRNLQGQINDKILSAVDLTLYDGKKGYTVDKESLEMNAIDNMYSIFKNDNTGKVYYQKRSGTTTEIYDVKANGNSVVASLIDSDIDVCDVYSYDEIVTFKDMNSKATKADMYVDGTKVATDVYPGTVHFSPDSHSEFFYMTDYDDGTAALYHYNIKSKKSTKVDDEFYSYGGIVKVDGNKFAFLSDYSEKSNTGDLKVFTGSDTIKVDSEVSDFYYDYLAPYAKDEE